MNLMNLMNQDHHLRPNLYELAFAVGELRKVQKAAGKGYKDHSSTTNASSLEEKVDAMLAKILPLSSVKSAD